jgi:glutamate N-acetyltransferase/amino-acid N-acetyltransferase
MPVNLPEPKDLLAVPGVRLGTAAAGIRYRGRDDLVLMELAPGSTAAAVFTRNAFCAAPVTVAREHLAAAMPRYLLINSGNANAGTGGDGLTAARTSCTTVAAQTGCRPEEVLPFSTGVIGEPLAVTRIATALPEAIDSGTPEGWLAAARAIMTTDTVPKARSRRLDLDGVPVTLTGMAKGSGMIRPDMATLLAFVACDAPVDPALLQRCLEGAVAGSFNRITVDGDTSTNDACVLIATGAAPMEPLTSADDPRYPAFAAAVSDLCTELAQAIVRDGEGATRFITVEVTGGRDETECLTVAYTIAHSPLVKTACYAADPNWGRILAAVGRAEVPDLDIGGVTIHLDATPIVRNGSRDPDYTEAAGQAVFDRAEYAIRVDLGRGQAGARIWTTDLSHDYVTINAEYRT